MRKRHSLAILRSLSRLLSTQEAKQTVQSLTDDKNKLNRIVPFAWARGRSEKSEFKITRKKFYKEKPME